MANYDLCVQLAATSVHDKPYMFLSSVIPGPNNPKNKIEVFLQPLIGDLKTLWNEGVDTYDIHANQIFKMKAALMWTVNDFSAYGMLSVWSTHGGVVLPCLSRSNTGVLIGAWTQSVVI